MRSTWMWGLAVLVAAAPVRADNAPADAGAAMRKLNELSAQYVMQFYAKDYDRAIASATQALEAAEAAVGPEDVQVAQVLNDLGHLYSLQQDPAKAEPLLERALRIRVSAFGEDGPAVVQSLHQLARVYTKQARHDLAQSMYKRSLAIMERTLTPGDPTLISVLEPYAASLRAVGMDVEAIPLETRIHALRNAVLKAAPKP